MSRRKLTRTARAFTLAELLVTLVILGLVMTFVAVIFAPIANAPPKHQAKVDTVQAATRALYRMQRDIRLTSKSAVYVCANSTSAPNCASPTGTLADAAVVAILTPLQNGNGAVQYDNTSNTGQPSWQGFQVYWLDANNNLQYAFGNTGGLGSGDDNGENAASANSAVKSALGKTPQTIATNINDIQVSANATIRSIGLKLFMTSTVNNRTNTASIESDTVARN